MIDIVSLFSAVAHWCVSCAPAGAGVPTTLGALAGAAAAAGGIGGLSGLAGNGTAGGGASGAGSGAGAGDASAGAGAGSAGAGAGSGGGAGSGDGSGVASGSGVGSGSGSADPAGQAPAGEPMATLTATFGPHGTSTVTSADGTVTTTNADGSTTTTLPETAITSGDSDGAPADEPMATLTATFGPHGTSTVTSADGTVTTTNADGSTTTTLPETVITSGDTDGTPVSPPAAEPMTTITATFDPPVPKTHH